MTPSYAIATESLSGQGLANYLSSINAAPLLSAADERELARRYSEEQDLDAARQLVYSH